MSESILPAAKAHLSKVDSVFERLVYHLNDIELRKRPANFAGFVRIIVNQQLSAKAAETIRTRIISKCSDGTMDPNTIKKIGIDELRSCGLSNSKCQFVMGLADHFEENPDYVDELRNMKSEEAFQSLVKIRGIGEWSAGIFMLFNLQLPDIFPKGDATLEKAILLLYGIKIDRRRGGAEELISSWSPYRSIAAQYLWSWVDQKQPDLI